jgi:hypothetical protein
MVPGMNAWRDEKDRIHADGTCPYCMKEVHFEAGPHFDNRRGTMTAFVTCSRCFGGVVMELDHFSPEKVLMHAPRPTRKNPEPEYETAVPESIRTILNQVYSAAKESAWSLVGLGCRVALDRMATHQGATEGMLGLKLQRLRELVPALIPTLDNADVVKLLGNVAAHESDVDLDEGDAEAAIDFTEEVLRTVYILPARRMKLEAKYPRKQKPKKP